MTDSTPYLLSIAGGGIALLLILVIKVRLEPFVSLLLVSAGVALAAGIPLAEIVPDMEAGMGKVLAHVAPIVGLGAMLGKMLELSGGAQRIADRLLRLFGEAARSAGARRHRSHLRHPGLLRRGRDRSGPGRVRRGAARAKVDALLRHAARGWARHRARVASTAPWTRRSSRPARREYGPDHRAWSRVRGPGVVPGRLPLRPVDLRAHLRADPRLCGGRLHGRVHRRAPPSRRVPSTRPVAGASSDDGEGRDGRRPQ